MLISLLTRSKLRRLILILHLCDKYTPRVKTPGYSRENELNWLRPKFTSSYTKTVLNILGVIFKKLNRLMRVMAEVLLPHFDAVFITSLGRRDMSCSCWTSATFWYSLCGWCESSSVGSGCLDPHGSGTSDTVYGPLQPELHPLLPSVGRVLVSEWVREAEAGWWALG